MKLLSLTLPDGQTINPPANLGPKGGLDTVKTILTNALSIMLILAVILSLIFMVLAGIQWITSGGDKTKLQSARAKMTWAIGGLIVCLTAFAVVSLLGYLFDVPLLSFP